MRKEFKTRLGQYLSRRRSTAFSVQYTRSSYLPSDFRIGQLIRCKGANESINEQASGDLEVAEVGAPGGGGARAGAEGAPAHAGVNTLHPDAAKGPKKKWKRGSIETDGRRVPTTQAAIEKRRVTYAGERTSKLEEETTQPSIDAP